MSTTPTPAPAAAAEPTLAPPQRSADEIAALQREVQRRGQQVEELQRRVMAPPQPAAQNQPMDAAQMKAEFFKQPVEATVAIAQRAAWEAAQRAQQANQPAQATLVHIAREEARRGNEDIWNKWGMEIEQMVVANVDPQYHTNINVWKNALNQVKGTHIDEILEMRRQQAPPTSGVAAPAVHISREGGIASPSSARPPAPPSEKLSDAEKRIAAKLGVSEEAYLKGKKFIENQSEKGPSSWDEYITTNSREARRKARDARKAAK